MRPDAVDHYLLPLEMLNPGEWADIAEVTGEPVWVGRMAELGVRSGSRVQLLQAGRPCLVRVGSGRLSLRGAASSRILVRPVAHSG